MEILKESKINRALNITMMVILWWMVFKMIQSCDNLFLDLML